MTSPCPAHPVSHYFITIGEVTFCMDCGVFPRAASVGRNAKRQDAEERLGPKDEHAVPPEEAGDAQNPPKG